MTEHQKDTPASEAAPPATSKTLLQANHVQLLAERGIPEHVALEHGLFSVDLREEKRLRRQYPGRQPRFPHLPLHETTGIGIPYPGLPEDGIPRVRVRADTIEFVRHEHEGQDLPTDPVVKIPRYITQAKPATVVPYIPPEVRRVSGDTKQAVFIVEAPLKALALIANGMRAIGLGGVLAGGHDTAALDQYREIAAHPMLKEIDWRGRLAIVVFDASLSTNPMVALGAAFIMLALEREGAHVWVTTIPHYHAQESDPFNGVIHRAHDQGPDDYLVRCGVEALQWRITQSVPASPLPRVARFVQQFKGAELTNAITSMLKELQVLALLSRDATLAERLAAVTKGHGVGVSTIKKMVGEFEDSLRRKSHGSSQDALTEVLSEIKLVEATNCRVFARVDGQVIPADSPKLRANIARLFNERTGGTVGATTIETALMPLLGAKLPHAVVPVRCAYDQDGSIWVDLDTSPAKYAHVTTAGVTVESACPIAFYRPQMMAPMPVPVIPANDADCKGVFDEAQKHFQIDRVQLGGAFAWAIGVVRPCEPQGGGKPTEYFVLLVLGPQGSGKTTFADSWSQAVDPKVTSHFKLPRDDEALAILAENTRSLPFNNLSSIAEWQSNALCELADGNGMVLRSLYTNRDTTVFKGSNAVALVSIGDVALAPDLLDRAISIVLPERTDYQEPEVVEAEFQKLRPKLLGALLYCASRALKDSAKTKAPKGVRMAGAARWALAAAPAAGFTTAEIHGVFASAIEDADEKVLDHPVAAALQQLVIVGTPWSGATKDLLAALTVIHEARIPATGTPTKKVPKRWPETARALASELRKLAKTLTRAGFSFVWPTGGGRGGRVLTIHRRAVDGGVASATAEPSADGLGMDTEEQEEAKPGDTAAAPEQAGTISGTIGTMSSAEPSNRSLGENRVGNDRNDGNDPFPSLTEEKKEKGEGDQGDKGRLLLDGEREGTENIVPTVPIVPTVEKQAGTMSPAGGVGSFPNRSAGPRTLRAQIQIAYLQEWPPVRDPEGLTANPPQTRLVVVLRAEDATTAYHVSYANPIEPERTVEPLLSFGWDGERDANAVPVLHVVDLLVSVQEQFQLGFGFVPTVIAASVVRKEVA